MANAEQALRWNGDTGRRWVAERERHHAVRRSLTPHLLRAAALAPGDRVLDVGCGCGETTIAAARSVGPGGAVDGLDLSAPALAVARESAAAAGVPGIRFVQGDAQTHPLAPAGFDVVLSSFGVMFFEDPDAAFANLRSGLRPAGRLAFLCWQDEASNEVFALAPRAVAAHATLPPGGGDGDAFTDPWRIGDLLVRAGFVDVRVEGRREPARLGSDVDDVLGYLRGTSRVRELLGRLDDQRTVERVLDALTEDLTARRRADGVWVEAAVWLVTAVAPPAGSR
ncbi:methyltransferase domain-containing protein [Micromonospora sp. WMMD1128]|uniref:class I SAM-dependent methyltransferase n=1 Tax=Micromonospora sp. WMMD1128 TaxID=3015150 RepID=UPI00248BDE11|nr:methyltransferase domain-containing protein [Micromonospora sp. WMMD1128]WBB74697.1 methyltransferase domain-containing protein [Micromonospora sp. WMMD1128]